jgi:hypothetical protein
MKKLAFLMTIITIVFLSACNAEETEEMRIDKQDIILRYDFSVIPESIRDGETVPQDLNNDYVNINQYRSPYFSHLINSFAYAGRILKNYNDVINVVILQNELEEGETYQNNQFTYFVKKDKDDYHFRIEDDGQMIINGNLDFDGNYQGEFHYAGDDLEFFLEDNKLTLRYYDADDDSQVYYEIIHEEPYLKVTINYEGLEEDYNLVSVSSDELSALYVDDRINNIKRLTVNDEGGLILFEQAEENGQMTAGYHLHALSNYTSITKINDEDYTVDGELFTYEEAKSNLIEISLPYLSDDEKWVDDTVLILGVRDQSINDEAVSIREPFIVEKQEAIESLVSELNQYLQNSL